MEGGADEWGGVLMSGGVARAHGKEDKEDDDVEARRVHEGGRGARVDRAVVEEDVGAQRDDHVQLEQVAVRRHAEVEALGRVRRGRGSGWGGAWVGGCC